MTYRLSDGICLVFAVAGSCAVAQASGFDNTRIGDLDLLFDPAKAAMELSFTYIDRNVDYEAANPREDKDTPLTVDGPSKARATPNVWNYNITGKVGFTDNIDCLARMNNPGTIEEVLPDPWQGKFSIVRTDLQTLGYDATCSYKIPVMEGGYFRLIGGARYIEATILTDKYNSFGTLASIDVKGDGFGWRAGAAFEYPEYAIRASIFYDSAIDLDMNGNLKTKLDTLALDVPATSQVTMPQGIEARVQSGIAPGWLMFAGVKWVDWSVLKNIEIQGDLSPVHELLADATITAIRGFNFKDGWTVTGGVGHQLTDDIQIGASVTWDQGIGTSYSDTYSFSLGGAWQFHEKIKLSLGGVAAYKTGAENRYPGGATIIDLGGSFVIDKQDHVDLSYDASWNFGIGTKLKVVF